MMPAFAVGRIFALLTVFAIGAVVTQLAPLSDLLAIEDALQFFLASIVFVSAWRPSARLFLEYPLNYGRLLSLAISFISASFMAASVWAVTWRAFGYAPAFGDTSLRFSFRYLAICGLVCAIAAPTLFEQTISRRRVGALLAGFAVIVLTALFIVYGSRLHLMSPHDAAPAPQGEEAPE